MTAHSAQFGPYVKKTAASAAALLATIALIGLGAAPANAAPPALPAGDALYTVDCSSATLQFYTLDSATASATPIGTGNAEAFCGWDMAWDPTTDTAYTYVQNNDNTTELYSADLVTGGSTLVGEITFNDDNLYVESLAIGLDGVAYVASEGSLYVLDLSTGALALAGVVDGLPSESYGASVDPSTGDLYFLHEGGDLFLVDPTALTATLVGHFDFEAPTFATYGLAIDSAGVAWVMTYAGSVGNLWSATLADFGGTEEFSGVVTNSVTDEAFYTFSLLLVPGEPAPAPAPALADTGFDSAPLLAGGILLAGLGALLVARGRRTERSA